MESAEKNRLNSSFLKARSPKAARALVQHSGYTFTTATSLSRIPFRQNRLLQVYTILFWLFWAFSGFTSTNLKLWMMENTLTLSYVILAGVFYRYYQFSDLSYTGMFIFLVLHVYGSQHAYAENPLGFWLSEQFNWQRNHYDRLVHLSFGLLLSYPMLELIRVKFKVTNWFQYLWPVELTLALSAVYEIVEWLVAGVIFPEKGPAFLGMQGDIWDAQADMGLAFLGSVVVVTGVWLKRKNPQTKA